MHHPIRIAVFLSGSGTTLHNLLGRAMRGDIPAEIVCVASSKPGVKGLKIAEEARIPSLVVERKKCASLEEFCERLFSFARKYEPDLVCLAGFLQLIHLPPDFQGKVMNIHPALIPSFCGKGFYGHHVHEAVIASGVKLTGCTVHYADNEYDHGPIILQRAVPVLDDDTPDSVAARVFAQECEAYPEAIRLFAEDRLKIEGRRVRIIDPR